MKKEDHKKNEDSGLRNRAEEKLRPDATLIENLSDEEVRKLAHELQVHQIELEMQNDELRKAQIEIEESRQKYTDLYNEAPVGYITLDDAGLILEANLTIAEMLATEDLLIHSVFHYSIIREDQDIFYIYLKEVFDGKAQKHTCEIRLCGKDDTTFYARLDGVLAQDSDGNSICRTSTTDTTERKKAAEEIKQLNKSLEQRIAERTAVLAKANEGLNYKNMELEQIAYITSHDLRAPLVSIEGFSRELERAFDDVFSTLNSSDSIADIEHKLTPALKKDITESQKYIHTSISRMYSIINGMLKVSRIGGAEIAIKQIDMNKLMSDIVDVFKFEIKEISVSLHLEELPPCMGDEDQINQMFSNFLGNALKYLGPNRRGIIRITGRKEDKRSVFCVEDNGIGIATDHQDRIFDIFYRINKYDNDGEGLGLAIVRKVLDRHGGAIRVESQPGKGSKFFVSLPG